MTAEELTATFEKYEKALIKHVRNKYQIKEDCKDLVYETYVCALGGTEYIKVPKGFAKSWWYYRVSDKADRYLRKAKTEAKKMQAYTNDPTAYTCHHIDLHDVEAMEILQEYWEGLSRSAHTRMRQRWQEEGREWLPFMYPKE